MPKRQSRPDRWQAAANKAEAAIAEAEQAASAVMDALSDLRDVQSEYQDWYDNFPENAQGSPTHEKLETIVNIDLEPGPDDLSAMRDCIDEAVNAELPRGFGRD